MSSQAKALRVGIDSTPMLVAQRTGIENYATALIRKLAALYHELEGISLSVYLHAGNPFASAASVRDVLELLEQAGLPHRIYARRRGYGLALSAYAGLDRLHLLHMLWRARPGFQFCPYIMTIYDIQSAGLSEEDQRIERSRLSFSDRRMIAEASGLIAISASTKRDLQTEFGPELAVPVQVIHLGVDPVFFKAYEQKQAMCRKYGLERYVLFVGTLQHRKNLPRLVEAFARLKQAHNIPHKLVLAGPGRWGAELVYAAVAENGVEGDVFFPGYVPASDLPGLYAGADVFTYPSLHEGFGIPLLEAMASGTVVLTSRLFSMPEVAGDAAILVDPYDVDAISAGLWRALGDNELRQRLITKGKARAERFTWRRTATDTLEFYRHIAREGKSLL